MLSIFKKIFGDKSQRDLKEIQPVLAACLQAYETVKTLDNDGLRAKTAEFRKRIAWRNRPYCKQYNFFDSAWRNVRAGDRTCPVCSALPAFRSGRQFVFHCKCSA